LLAIDKQVAGVDVAGDGILNAVGDIIDYNIVVSNTGNTTLTNVVVTDPLTGLNTTIAGMVPGGVQAIPTNYALTQADIDSDGTAQDAIAGFIDNTATADSDQTVLVADTEQVPLADPALLTIDKQVAGVDVAGDGILNAVGDIIDYNIVLTNAGNQTLTNVTVTDPLTDLSSLIATLAVGAVHTIPTNYTLTQADIDSNGTVQDAIPGFIDNTATTDSDQTGPVVDSEQVPLIRVPLLAIDKQVTGVDVSGDDLLNAVGDIIDYNIVVRNTGNQTLTNVVVTDPLTGLNTTIASMTPGGVQTIPTNYTLTEADIVSNGTVQDAIAGFIDNTATADSDQTVPVTDTEQVPLSSLFTLTTAVDHVIGTSGNDLIRGPVVITGLPLAAFPIDTLQSSDIIDGGEGFDSAIFHLEEQGIAAPTIRNVELFEITTNSSFGDTLDMSNIDGVTDVSFEAGMGPLTLTNMGDINTHLSIVRSITGVSSSLNVNYLDAALVSTNDTLHLQLFDVVGQSVSINNETSGAVETLRMVLNGSASNVTLGGDALTSAETLRIEGSSNLFLRADAGFGFATIDASTALGGLTLDLFNVSNNLIVTGGIGDDHVLGGTFDDEINGGLGNDEIDGSFGSDQINGDDGDDIINGGSGFDEINGGAGDDEITGGSLADVIDGGNGNDTFIFGLEDSLNTNLDHIINIGIGDTLDFNLDINPSNGTDLIFLSSRASSGLTSTSLADDIAIVVNDSEPAFDSEGDTVIFRLDGDSTAGNDVWYLVQNQNNNSVYDADQDTVIALVGYPPEVPLGFFVSLDIVNGNLQVAQQEIVI